jgi:hypothetical protein
MSPPSLHSASKTRVNALSGLRRGGKLKRAQILLAADGGGRDEEIARTTISYHS